MIRSPIIALPKSNIINPQVATAVEVSNPNKNLRSTGAAWNSGADTVETIPASTTGSISFEGNDQDHAGGGARNDFFVGLSRQSDTPAANFTGIHI